MVKTSTFREACTTASVNIHTQYITLLFTQQSWDWDRCSY